MNPWLLFADGWMAFFAVRLVYLNVFRWHKEGMVNYWKLDYNTIETVFSWVHIASTAFMFRAMLLTADTVRCAPRQPPHQTRILTLTLDSGH